VEKNNAVNKGRSNKLPRWGGGRGKQKAIIGGGGETRNIKLTEFKGKGSQFLWGLMIKEGEVHRGGKEKCIDQKVKGTSVWNQAFSGVPWKKICG